MYDMYAEDGVYGAKIYQISDRECGGCGHGLPLTERQMNGLDPDPWEYHFKLDPKVCTTAGTYASGGVIYKYGPNG